MINSDTVTAVHRRTSQEWKTRKATKREKKKKGMGVNESG